MKMYYDPEFKRALMEVHADIGQKAFLSPGGKLIAYSFVQEGTPNKNFLSLEEIVNAVFTLQKVGAVNVVREYPSQYRSGIPDAWDIELIQPKFDDFLEELLTIDGKPGWVFIPEDQQKDYSWEPNESDSKGILDLPNGERLIFSSGRFGGINELIKDTEVYVTRSQLRQAIKKHSQGEKNETEISRWKSEIKKDRPQFFEFFDIEYKAPNKYRLNRLKP